MVQAQGLQNRRPARRDGSSRTGAANGLVIIAVAMTAMFLAACSESPDWRTAPLDSGFPELDLALTADDGEVITEARLAGSVTLLFFGYTHCPDACPATMTRLSAAIDALPEAHRDQVTVLFVSVDPARDDPQRLATYTRFFGSRFVGATGELADVRRLANRYGSSFRHGPEDEAGQYPVTHGSNVLVFDRDGRARLLIGPGDGIEAIVHDLQQLLAS